MEDNVPYMTKWEKRGFEKGVEIGVEIARKHLLAALRERFKKIPAHALKSLSGVSDLARMMALMQEAYKAPSMKAFLDALKG